MTKEEDLIGVEFSALNVLVKRKDIDRFMEDLEKLCTSYAGEFWNFDFDGGVLSGHGPYQEIDITTDDERIAWECSICSKSYVDKRGAIVCVHSHDPSEEFCRIEKDTNRLKQPVDRTEEQAAAPVIYKRIIVSKYKDSKDKSKKSKFKDPLKERRE